MQFRTIAVFVAILMPSFASAADINAHLDGARENLIRRDTKAAAADIHKAAQFVEKEASTPGTTRRLR